MAETGLEKIGPKKVGLVTTTQRKELTNLFKTNPELGATLDNLISSPNTFNAELNDNTLTLSPHHTIAMINQDYIDKTANINLYPGKKGEQTFEINTSQGAVYLIINNPVKFGQPTPKDVNAQLGGPYS